MSRRVLNPGRLAAAQSLVGVNSGGHAEQLLAKFSPPNAPDRRLAWHICLGVLRNRRIIDSSLQPLIERSLQELDQEVLVALRIGAFEHYFSRTKAHAVVDQAVEIVKVLDCAKAKGFVNAVLRRLPAEPSNFGRPILLNHPDWLLERWDARYPSPKVDLWCSENNDPPKTYLVTKANDESLPARWASQGADVSPAVFDGRHITNMYQVDTNGLPIDGLHGYETGAFWVQDVASVLAADMIEATDAMQVLDACAAPGGKTMRIASTGASVTAVDASSKRLRRLRQNLSRVQFDIDILRHDWVASPPLERKWDSVLVDAPCTGLGTLRRHPEIRWRRTPMDIIQIAPTQAMILHNAAKSVSPNGCLVYSVCSPEPEEGRGQIQAFLDENKNFRLEAEMETAPPRGDYDAFYMAKMVCV